MFRFRLALALGKTIAEIGGMSMAEYAEWQAYYTLEPFGTERDSLHAGIVAATIANVNRVKGRSFRPGDFMPDFKPKKAQPVAQMKATFERFMKAVNKQSAKK